MSPFTQKIQGQPAPAIICLRFSVIAKTLCVSLFFSLSLTLPAAAQGDTRTTTTPSSAPSARSEPRFIVEAPQVSVFSDCARSFAGTPEGASEARSDLLDKKGPQLGLLYSLSSLSVMGFSRGGWPVAIEYELEQDSLLLVIISPEGQRPLIYRLEGKKGHWLTKLQIPPAIGNDLRVSQYLVQTLNDGVGQLTPSHVHIYGIAAGPKAVGSIGIDHVNFTPGNIRVVQHEKAQFSYHSISDFDDTQVSFVRVAKTNTGEIVAGVVADKDMGSILQDHVKNGNWDGAVKTEDIRKNFPPQFQSWVLAPHGQHLLQVRAWLHRDHGGDFVFAHSQTMVTVE